MHTRCLNSERPKTVNNREKWHKNIKRMFALILRDHLVNKNIKEELFTDFEILCIPSMIIFCTAVASIVFFETIFLKILKARRLYIILEIIHAILCSMAFEGGLIAKISKIWSIPARPSFC